MITKNTKSIQSSKKSPTQSIGRKPTQQKKSSCKAVSREWMLMRRFDLMAHISDAEKKAYTIIKSLGYKVVRQQPINTGRRIYFADLYLPELKTIFELDGGYHNTTKQRRLDTNRSSGIWRMGYHVVRLSNHDAREPEKIKAKIRLILNKTGKG